MKKSLLFAAFAASALPFGAASAANLLVNGSFENPAVPSSPGYTIYGNGGDIGGWTVAGDATNAVGQIVAGYAESAVTFTPQDGQVHLDLTGAGNTGFNSVSQSVNLGAGAYSLSFYVGDVGGGASGNQPVYAGTASIDLLVNNVLVGTYSNGSAPAGQTDWAKFTYTLNSAGGPTSITFRNATAPGLDNYVGLDNVSLAAVPEPATWALMIGGFGMAGAAMRRRKPVAAFA